jgi:hypothetical protein
MAKPIKNTPVLKGKDLIAFHENMERVANIPAEEKRKERERVEKSAERIIKSLTFAF